MPDQKTLDLATVEARCDRSWNLHAQIAASLAPLERLPNPRQYVASDAIELGAEFHGGIVLLIRHGHYASANALMRPLIETTVRAIWIIYDASAESVGAVTRNQDKKTLGALLTQLRKRTDLPVIYPLIETLSQSPNPLNSYAHAGYEQLSRKEIGFHPEEILSQLMVADLFAVLCLDLSGVLRRQPEIKSIVLPLLDAGLLELQVPPGDSKLASSGVPAMPEWDDLPN